MGVATAAPAIHLVGAVWRRQDEGGQLVLVEQPVNSAALKLSMMEARSPVVRVSLDHYAFVWLV